MKVAIGEKNLHLCPKWADVATLLRLLDSATRPVRNVRVLRIHKQWIVEYTLGITRIEGERHASA